MGTGKGVRGSSLPPWGQPGLVPQVCPPQVAGGLPVGEG